MSKEAAPMWAREEAARRVNAMEPAVRWDASDYGLTVTFTLFADMIAKHEEPPVDPLLLEAREIAAEEGWTPAYRENILSGYLDDSPCVKFTLKGLRRGIELGKAGEPTDGE